MATGRVPTTANSPLTAKGDLFGYSTTQARVAVGSDGDTLVADSASSVGLRYTSGVGLTQPLINGAMDVWQRGTSIACPAGSNLYTADRWKLALGGGATYTVSRQATNDTTNLPFIQYAARVQRDSGQTGVNIPYFIQGIETVNSIPYAGKTITVSFYARKGANFSAASDILTLTVAQGTGTDQDPAGAYTGQNSLIATNFTLTSTWQRFTATGNVQSSATEIKAFTHYTPVGTAGANDWYEITGFQVDVGNVALPFRRSGGTIQGELAACQRYYYRTGGNSAFQPFAYGTAVSTTNTYIGVQFPVAMRVPPTVLDYANVSLQDGGGGNVAVTGITINSAGTLYTWVNATTASGLTSFRPYFIAANNSTSAHFGLGAEL